MPIIKSAKKRLRQSRVRAARNSSLRNHVRGVVKAFLRLIEKEPKEAADEFPRVQKVLATAAKNRIFSAKKSARKISQLNRALNATAGK